MQSELGQSIEVERFCGNERLTVRVLAKGWSPVEEYDAAFLVVAHLPEGVTPVVLGIVCDRVSSKASTLSTRMSTGLKASFLCRQLIN